MLNSMQRRTLVVLKTIAWLVLLSFPLTAQGQTANPTATVNWSVVHQTMDGFGASTGYQEQNANLTSSQADLFFTTTSGIGLEWIRIQDSNNGTSTPDLATLQLAVARGAKVLLTMGSHDGGSSSLFAAHTSQAVNKINFLRANSVTVDALGPVNEPTNTGNVIWTAAQMDSYISTSLGPALAGLNPPVPIAMPEQCEWFKDCSNNADTFYSVCLNDANCAKYVKHIGYHGYSTVGYGSAFGTVGNRWTSPPADAAAVGVWETEVTSGFSGFTCDNNSLAAYDPSIADALVWAQNIHFGLTTGEISMWMYWNLISGYSCNDGLTDSSANPAKRFYALGNWSKFVRSGWVRIDATATPVGGVFVSAYKDPASGNFAIVGINQNASDQPLNFVLGGFPAASVTPWVTSASLDLAQQPSISAVGGTFSGTLPASSVTTFVSSTAVLPPTNVIATVH
jgi:glucuronoarabinoxylan endo-1,4-beta-xylanase